MLSALLPREREVLAHCHRTAAVARLVAHRLFLPTGEKQILEESCLLHHYRDGLRSRLGARRLLQDVCGVADTPLSEPDALPPELLSILRAFEMPGTGSSEERRLGSLLRLCDAFDREFEARVTEGGGLDGVFQRLRRWTEEGLWPKETQEALEDAMHPLLAGAHEQWQPLSFPQAAARMLALMSNPRLNLSDLGQIAGTDPATAGKLMQLANSALFGAHERVSTLFQGIARLGLATTRKVLLASALQPVLSSSSAAHLWPHSLEVADLAEQLAVFQGLDPAEAYLTGLLHDVGRIALVTAPLYESARLKGLESSGCPPIYAENIVLRTDHAAIGAGICRGWRLPERMVRAIGFHHSPELTECRLAHALFLSEYLSDSEEDLPSAARLDRALKSLGLTLREAEDLGPSTTAAWMAA